MRLFKEFLLTAIAALFVVSCGGSKMEGTPDKVLSKKVYSKVIMAYDNVYDFYEGIAVVGKDSRYGLIDFEGNLIAPCTYKELYACFDGMIAFKNEKYKWGYLDKSGKVIVEAEYDGVHSFVEGMGNVEKKSKHGFVDKTGKLVIPCDYDRASDFSEGLSAVRKNWKWGYINQKNEEVISLNLDQAYIFKEGVAVIEKNGTEMLLDHEGNIVYTLGDNMVFLAATFQEGKIPFMSKSFEGVRCGYKNTKGENVIPEDFQFADEFENGKALAILNDEVVYINAKGKVVEVVKDFETILDAFNLAQWFDINFSYNRLKFYLKEAASADPNYDMDDWDEDMEDLFED